MQDYELIADRLTADARAGVVDSTAHIRLLMDAADAIRHMARLLENESLRKSRLESAWVSYRASVQHDLDIPG